jgi:hypothetical protein
MGMPPWAKRKAAKYNATRVVDESGSFDSKLEKEVYDHLVAHHGSAAVEVKPTAKLVPRITWRVDFKVGDQWHEAKGVSTEGYKLRLRLWELFGPGVLHIWRKDPRTDMLFVAEVRQPGTSQVVPRP